MIDWHQLIKNLQSAGIGVTQAASMAGVPALHLEQILKDYAEEPLFTTGLKLLDLHFDVCPERQEELLEE